MTIGIIPNLHPLLSSFWALIPHQSSKNVSSAVFGSYQDGRRSRSIGCRLLSAAAAALAVVAFTTTASSISSSPSAAPRTHIPPAGSRQDLLAPEVDSFPPGTFRLLAGVLLVLWRWSVDHLMRRWYAEILAAKVIVGLRGEAKSPSCKR